MMFFGDQRRIDGPQQISKMLRVTTKANGYKTLIIVAKLSFSDV